MRPVYAVIVTAVTLAFGVPAGRATECDASSATRRALDALETHTAFTNTVRRERARAVEKLLAQRPADVFLHLDYISSASRNNTAENAELIARYKSFLELHPGNSEYEFLYGVALVDTDTPAAISRLKQIPVDAAVAPLAHLELAKIYEYGKFADRPGARAQLAAYLDACPGSLWPGARGYAESLATPEMAAKYAGQLRSRLRSEKDPQLLAAWGTVWNLEFMARPPAQQEELRKGIAADLSRLRRQVHSNNLDFLAALESGYHMTGNKDAERQIEDRIIAQYPHSFEGEMASSKRFEAEHPYPKQEDSEATKQAHDRAVLEKADAELKRDPKDSGALRDRFDALSELDGISSDEIVAAGEAIRTALRGDLGWFNTPPMQFHIARVYLEKKVRVDEVPQLIAEGREDYERRKQANESDRTVDEMKKDLANSDMIVLYEGTDLLLGAAKQLGKPEIAKAAVDEVSRTKTDVSYFEIQSWKIKGKWAELNGRKLDALLMYHASLGARPVGYKERGKKTDEVKEGYDRLWKELGGSDDGKGAWLQAVAGAKVAQDGGWEKAPRDWPVWELADLNGKTWKLADFKGKKLLINVWATWCGPCRGEHPYLQTLYDEIKDRNDIQVLTFSIDTSIGDLAPYMKDNKYTFPVLLAADYVNELLPVVGVPQTWIVDEAGKWNWKQEGFGDGEQWKKMVMEKLGIAQNVAEMEKK